MRAAPILPGTTSNIATSSTSGSAGKTTPKPSATELSSCHSAAAGALATNDAKHKAIKRSFGLLWSEDGPDDLWMHQLPLECTGTPRTHRHMGYTETHDNAASGE